VQVLPRIPRSVRIGRLITELKPQLKSHRPSREITRACSQLRPFMAQAILQELLLASCRSNDPSRQAERQQQFERPQKCPGVVPLSARQSYRPWDDRAEMRKVLILLRQTALANFLAKKQNERRLDLWHLDNGPEANRDRDREWDQGRDQVQLHIQQVHLQPKTRRKDRTTVTDPASHPSGSQKELGANPNKPLKTTKDGHWTERGSPHSPSTVQRHTKTCSGQKADPLKVASFPAPAPLDFKSASKPISNPDGRAQKGRRTELRIEEEGSPGEEVVQGQGNNSTRVPGLLPNAKRSRSSLPKRSMSRTPGQSQGQSQGQGQMRPKKPRKAKEPKELKEQKDEPCGFERLRQKSKPIFMPREDYTVRSK
jgi:hypothetical protein